MADLGATLTRSSCLWITGHAEAQARGILGHAAKVAFAMVGADLTWSPDAIEIPLTDFSAGRIGIDLWRIWTTIGPICRILRRLRHRLTISWWLLIGVRRWLWVDLLRRRLPGCWKLKPGWQRHTTGAITLLAAAAVAVLGARWRIACHALAILTHLAAGTRRVKITLLAATAILGQR